MTSRLSYQPMPMPVVSTNYPTSRPLHLQQQQQQQRRRPCHQHQAHNLASPLDRQQGCSNLRSRELGDHPARCTPVHDSAMAACHSPRSRRPQSASRHRFAEIGLTSSLFYTDPHRRVRYSHGLTEQLVSPQFDHPRQCQVPISTSSTRPTPRAP